MAHYATYLVTGGVATSLGWRYIPNLLCVIRILCSPSLFFSILIESSWSLPIILLAAVTDFLDGYTARRFGAESIIGSFLDPLADKIFCNTALWSIYFLKYCSISMFLVALFLTLRDLALLFGSLLVISKKTSGKDLKPIFMSKVCTALIFSLCCLAVIDIGMKDVILEILSLLCLIGIIITSCIYTVRFFK